MNAKPCLHDRIAFWSAIAAFCIGVMSIREGVSTDSLSAILCGAGVALISGAMAAFVAGYVYCATLWGPLYSDWKRMACGRNARTAAEAAKEGA